jgi:SAM-dependent methyltransferase
LIRADAREVPFRGASFDSVVNLFSSFGYFGELDDARVAAEIARVLREGGVAVMDLMNPSYVRANLRDESVREGDDFQLRERRALLDGGRRVVKDVELTSDGSTQRWREDVRLYELDEVRALLAARDLRVESVHGGFDSRAFDASAPRMLISARRSPARR